MFGRRHHGSAMPAGFSRVRAETFGQDEKAKRPARLGGQLQAAAGGQVNITAQLRHDQRHSPGPQGLFGNPEQVEVRCAAADDQTRRVDKPPHPAGMQALGLALVNDPHDRPFHARGKGKGKGDGARPRHFMGTAIPQREETGKVLPHRSIAPDFENI